MPDFYKHIKGLLTGEALGIPQSRLEWAGYTEALELYNRTPVGQRSEIIEAIRRIISEEKDWGLIADTIHLAYVLRIEEAKGAINNFQSERLNLVDSKWKDTVGTQVDTFLKGV